MAAHFHIWFEAARPRTLPAAVIPVLVGSALAERAETFALLPAAICLSFALLVQIGTNFANDRGDFVKGADGPDRVGPRRAVAAGLISPRAMGMAAALVFGTAFVLGLSLIHWGGWVLLPVGLASLFFGWAYTSGPFPLAYHGLGDAFVFVFFGLVAVVGTTYVMTGELNGFMFAAAVPVGLLATNILVVNNSRDATTDARAGKRTLVVRFGQRFSVFQYAGSFVVALAIPVALAASARDWWLAVPVALFPWAWQLARRLHQGGDGPTLNSLLGATAKFLLAFGVLWAAVLAFPR